MYKHFKLYNYYKKRYLGKILILGLIALGFLLTSNLNLFGFKINHLNENSYKNLNTANGNSNLFEGTLSPLNITEYGNLYNMSQEISLTNQEEINLKYYLDDYHSWEVSQINNSIDTVQDTRDWINNSDFLPITTYTVYEDHQSPHEYQPNRGRAQTLDSISQSGAIAMRVHFVNLSFEDSYDNFLMENENNTLCYIDTGFKLDFFSPWILGSTLYFYFESDGSIQEWGYEIDYYEFINGSSNIYRNARSWGFNQFSYTKTGYGAGQADGEDSMYLALYSEISSEYPPQYDATYYEGNFVELYQNISIPRGKVIDGYISFDYYPEFAMESNENFIYCEINNQKIYSKGLGDIVKSGRRTWHHTGKIYLGLWSNSSNIFGGIQNNQEFNISVGIMSGASVMYTGFEDQCQQIFWFDNLSLVLTTIANCSQEGINLKLNSLDLTQGDEWGTANILFNGNWDSNPIIITVNTTSPNLKFNLDTILAGYHKGTSKINQQNEEGISYTILNNGTVYWEFLHNFYMPSFYSEFEFIVSKPSDWQIISVFDPTYLPVIYEGGNYGDAYIKINRTQAKFPGWWKFKAISPNFIEEENTITSRNGQWGYNEFYSGDFAEIKTQINYSNIIPSGLDQTTVKLTIYNPQGGIWHQETKVPQLDGTLIFSKFWFSSSNTTGGIYNFTLFWNNGTALGGLSSSFTVIHQSYITLLKPDDAREDLTTGGTLGDIIPLRVFGRDFENNNSITNAIVSYNWSSGTQIMTEAALGIYETILDTGDLGSLGLYKISIQINKTGFTVSNITFTINLGEDTVLQRLDSDSEIILNANSTIKFYYYSDFDEDGIVGAIVTVNISNPSYYKVNDLLDGNYEITFNTAFIAIPGVYRLQFTFYAPGYEEQVHIYQFRIINPPIDNPGPDLLFLIIILLAAIIIIGVLASLSIRSYVMIPRRRKRESELLARTQRFKDLSNIQAIVVINKTSGIPIFSKTYSILEKHKKELFSGFIQAITTIGEEIVGREVATEDVKPESKSSLKERLLELDFKYFYCLINDKEDIRIVFILKEKASQRLKEQIMHLSLALTLHLSEIFEKWDGSLDQFDDLVPPILNDYIELYYKESFIIGRTEHIAKLRKDSELNSMETRILNVIYSIAKSKSEFDLDYIITSVHETNKDKVIDALETLIQKKIIIPKTS
ncbi:MAG: hypothetical protein ACFFA2_08775 [Promethearchaeota archaeon]